MKRNIRYIRIMSVLYYTMHNCDYIAADK